MKALACVLGVCFVGAALIILAAKCDSNGAAQVLNTAAQSAGRFDFRQFSRA